LKNADHDQMPLAAATLLLTEAVLTWVEVEVAPVLQAEPAVRVAASPKKLAVAHSSNAVERLAALRLRAVVRLNLSEP
jgi:hypothetical protein